MNHISSNDNFHNYCKNLIVKDIVESRLLACYAVSGNEIVLDDSHSIEMIQRVWRITEIASRSMVKREKGWREYLCWCTRVPAKINGTWDSKVKFDRPTRMQRVCRRLRILLMPAINQIRSCDASRSKMRLELNVPLFFLLY